MRDIIIIIVIIVIFTPAVQAADSTPSADIKAKLEELKKEVASRAAKLKQEITKKLNNKAYVGNVKSISSSSLTLASSAGPKLVSINQDTFYESKVKTKTKFSQKSLSEEDYLAALGDVDETGVLLAKKIVLLPTTNQKPTTYLWGQIISVTEKLFTLKDPSGKNIAATIPSEYEAKLNYVIIATGVFNKNEIFEAEFVHVISSKKPNPTPKESTKSASPSGKQTKK